MVAIPGCRFECGLRFSKDLNMILDYKLKDLDKWETENNWN